MPKPQREPVHPPVTMYGGAGEFVPMKPTGVGGNHTLVNQNEGYILDSSVYDTPVAYCETYGYEDDSHTQGVYRRDLI